MASHIGRRKFLATLLGGAAAVRFPEATIATVLEGKRRFT
jgi:hypothetical protein